MTEISNTGIVAVGKPTTSSTPTTNDNGQSSAYSAYTSNFNYGYNYTTGQYDPAAYAQYCNAYNQYYGYNQQYQYDATTGQYNYYPTGQTTPVQSQTSQNQTTTQTAVSTPTSTVSSVQQSTMIGPQLPPPPPPASTLSQTVTKSPYTYSANQTTTSSVPAVLPPPPPPPVPVASSFQGANISSAMFPQQSNMMMPATSIVQPPITSNHQFGSTAAIQPPTNALPFSTGMTTSTAGSSQLFNSSMGVTIQSATPAVQTAQFTVPPPSVTTLPNYGYGYDYNYLNQQYNNTSMKMNTSVGTGNPIAAPVGPTNTNYGQQHPYSNQQQNNFQNYQQGQYNQMPNQQQSYKTDNQMQYTGNQTNQSYTNPNDQFGTTNSYHWMDAFKVNDKQKYTTDTGMDQSGQKPVQQNNRYGNMNKKGKIKKQNFQKIEDQSLKQEAETTAPEPERPKEKLVLSKKVGPVDSSKPKGTFAALLGAVEFEPDEYDQSTESESEEEESEEKTDKTSIGTASFLSRASKNTSSSNANSEKFPGLPSAPKKQLKSFTSKRTTAAPMNLEFDPEAFGLPTSFTGRLPKVDNTESEVAEQDKRQLPMRESFRPKQSYYDWKPPARNNSFPNKQSEEISDASYEADFPNSYSERSNWNNKDDFNRRFNSYHNNQKPFNSSFDGHFQPELEENIPNMMQPPPLTKKKWVGNKQHVGPTVVPDAVVSQNPYFHEIHYQNDPGEGSYNHKYGDYSELPSNKQFQTNFHKPCSKEWEKPNNQRGRQQFHSRNNVNETIIDKPHFKRPNRFAEKPPVSQLFECEDRDDRFPEKTPPFNTQVPPKDPFESESFKSKEFIKESGPPISFAGTMNSFLTKFMKKNTPDPSLPTPLAFSAKNTSQTHDQELDMAAFGLPTSFAGKITSKNNQQSKDDGQYMDDIQDEDFRYGQSSMSSWDDVQDTDWRKNQKNTSGKDPSKERFSNRNNMFDINSRNTDFVSIDPYFQHSEHFDSEDLNDYSEPDYAEKSSRGQVDTRFSGKRKSFEGKDSLIEDTKGKLDHWFGRDKTNVNLPIKGRFSDTEEPFKRMKPTENIQTSKFEPGPFKRHLLPPDAPKREGTKRIYPLMGNTEEPIKRFQSDCDGNNPFNRSNPLNNLSIEPLKRPHFSDVTQPFGKEPQSAFHNKAFERDHFPSDIESTDRTPASFHGRPSPPHSLFRRGPPQSDVSIEPFKRDLPSSNLNTETFKRGFLSSDVTIEPFKRPSDVTPDRFSNRPPVKIEPFKRVKSFDDVAIEPLRKGPSYKEATIEPFRKVTPFSAVTIEPFKKDPSYKNVKIEPFRKGLLSDVVIEPFRKGPVPKDLNIEPFRKESLSSDVKIEPFMKKHFTKGKNNRIETPKENPLLRKDCPPKSEVPTDRKRTGFTDQPIFRDLKHINKPESQISTHPLVTKLVGTKGSKQISTVKTFTQEIITDVKVAKSLSENTSMNKSINTRPPSPKSIIKKSETESPPLSVPVKPALHQTTKTKDSSTVTNPKPNSTLAFLKSIMNRKAGSSMPTTTSTTTSTTLIATTKPMDTCEKSKSVTTGPLLTISSNSTKMSKSTDSKMVTSQLSDSKKYIPEPKGSHNVKPTSKLANFPAVSMDACGKLLDSKYATTSQLLTMSSNSTKVSKPTDSKMVTSQLSGLEKSIPEPKGSHNVKPTSKPANFPAVSMTLDTDIKPDNTKPSEHFGPTNSNLISVKSSEHSQVSVSSTQTSKPTDTKQTESKPSDDNGTTKTSSLVSKTMTSPKQANEKLASPQLSPSQSNTTTCVNTPSTNTFPKTLYSKPVDHFSATTILQKSSPHTIGKEKIKADPHEVEFQKIIDQVTDLDLKTKMLNTKCNLCHVELTSNSMAVQHYRGKNHQKKLKSFQNELSLQVNATSTFKAPVDATQDSNKYCAVCQMSFLTPSQASTHYTSQTHTAKMKQSTLPKSKAVLRCELCDVTVYYQTELDAHLNGAKHMSNRHKKSSPVGNVPASVSPIKLVPSIACESPAITKTSQIKAGNIVEPKTFATDSIHASTKSSSEDKLGSIDERKSDTKDVKPISAPLVTTLEIEKQEMLKPSDTNLTKSSIPVNQGVTTPSKNNSNSTKTSGKKEETTKDSTSNSKDASKEIISDNSAKNAKDLTSTPKDATPKSTVKDVPKSPNSGASTSTISNPNRGIGGIERRRGGFERGRGGMETIRGGMERGRGGMERGRGGMERGRGGMERGRGGMERGRGGMERGRGGMERGRGGMETRRGGIERGRMGRGCIERGGMERGRGGFVRGRGMDRFDRGYIEYDDDYREPFGGPFPRGRGRGPVHHGLERRHGLEIDRDFGSRDEFHHHPEFNGPPPRRLRFM